MILKECGFTVGGNQFHPLGAGLSYPEYALLALDDHHGAILEKTDHTQVWASLDTGDREHTKH